MWSLQLQCQILYKVLTNKKLYQSLKKHILSTTGSHPCTEYDENGKCVKNELKYDSEPTIIVDINGPKGPNIIGRDVFLMQISSEKGVVPLCFSYTKKQVNSNCRRNGLGTCCLKKIMNDSWDFKNGYPFP